MGQMAVTHEGRQHPPGVSSNYQLSRRLTELQGAGGVDLRSLLHSIWMAAWDAEMQNKACQNGTNVDKIRMDLDRLGLIALLLNHEL